jgi:hypothetical protein
MISAAQIIAAAEGAAKLVSAATSAVAAVQQAFDQVKGDMSVTDIAEIEARLADAHAKSRKLSAALDAKLAAAAQR